MQIQSNWATPIGNHRFTKEDIGTDVLLNEVMMLPETMTETKIGQNKFRQIDEVRKLPLCYDAIEKFLRPKVSEFIEYYGGRKPKDLKWHAWVHACLQGQALAPHVHMGDSFISSVLYLTDSRARMVLRDSRAPMVRCLPVDMIHHQHDDVSINPQHGAFVIFPSYVDHYVLATDPELRVSLGIDWCFS